MSDVMEKLRAQQAKTQMRSAQWMVAEQLMDICRKDPRCAELLDKDLDAPEMSIIMAEKQIKAFADSHKSGSFACVTPAESDRILRKFYGLPEAPGNLEKPENKPEASPAGSPLAGLDLESFLT
ncbi:MAG: hypothetical protein IJV64_12845 [Oscillospiraceae bacterium]|nr:hypothetical protein [Oscillospiraceae bacterium]